MSAEGGPAGYRIRFAEDGPEFRCLPGDTLLRAALREGIGLPYECVSGGCGTCRVQLKSGDLDDVWPQAPGLPARSRDKGFRLACQSRPQSDCTISIRLPLAAPHGPRPRSRRAILVSREMLTQDMAEFQFTTGDAADFLPGQFALLSLPGVTGDRAYSMSNLPNADGHWRFTIKRMNNGSGGRALFEAMTVGTEVTLDGPYGLSYLRTESPRNIVCIAGGSGLSPVMSILAAAARDTLVDRRITLFFGARQPADLCAETLIARDPITAARVVRHHAISDLNVPASEWQGERGFIHEVARRHLEAAGNPADNDYYFCGPSPMTDAVQKMLFDLKVPVGQIFYDRFV